jgi:ubiquinone/menaquinone biosynthesis C-methylase UbiE
MNISDPNLQGMKEDWNARARQNARWFINTAHDRQAENEFDQTGRIEVQNLVRADLALLTQRRDPHHLRLLEIGCGIGRMTRPLAEIFGEVYAIDVSGEMIVRGRRRLGDCTNVIFSETNGVDFHLFADRFFDVIFCAYVYQHVPMADVIRANLTDAYRVLRPGGVFKFQTNGVTNEIFRGLTKDTWMGEAFEEHAIRSLARELDAQMISLSGAGSQYCWTVWRRRMTDMEQAEVPLSPPVPIIDLTSHRQQSLVMAGLDANSADINNVTIQLGETSIEPYYVGPILDREAPFSHLRIDFTIPDTEPAGLYPLTIRLKNGSTSPSISLEVRQPRPLVPSIAFITNGEDGGLDIESTGPKSRVRIFVEGILAWPNWKQLEVLIGQMHIPPNQIDFVPGNGLYMVEFALPEILPGTITVALVLGDRCSASTSLLVRRESFMARLRRLYIESVALHVIKRVKKWWRTWMLELK